MKKCLLFLAVIAGTLVGSLFAEQKENSSIVLEQFNAFHATNDKFKQESRNELVRLMNEGQVEAGALTGFLRDLYPDFAGALRIAGEEPINGILELKRIAEAKDPFLAAESSYFLSRVLISEGRYEEALPYLKKMRDDWNEHSLRNGEALYYQGVCYSNMLQRTAAADALNGFVEDYPNASPRLIGAALDLIASLERVHRGSIDDVASHMEFSRRKLDLKDVGEMTQISQVKIVAMLDDLIKMAEEQEQPPPPDPNSSQGQGQGKPSSQAGKGQGNGQGGLQQGNANAQNAPRVVRRIRGASESAWDDLRKRDRGTDALGALKSKYPARYRLLVDQYYRSVQDGEKARKE